MQNYKYRHAYSEMILPHCSIYLKTISWKAFLDMNVFFIDWVGIGFSNNGEPTNADLCVLWSDWKGEIKFEVIFRYLFSMLLCFYQILV